MLISKLPDNDGGKGEGLEVTEAGNNAHEYQTANELFELMAKNQNFDTGDVDKLTTRDLVLLYKNIDLGTKLMSNANELRHRKPNQHVETVVYEEPESDGSDVSDIYSNEDLHNVFLINKERIDLLNNATSVENTLCHKIGDLEIHTSDVTTEYDKHFLFKDPYIKEQLKSLKLMNNSNNPECAVLPASLLDYICCKRLEDNYNFYMDNIIRYVKHTIEQLKRISNGDYLTDKAKEKWREVEHSSEELHHSNTKVLATSTSIPLHVEQKIGGRKSTWDDIVHSAVDIRSLSKILEKKIVVEVPKLICGSYKLMSKCCADNLIISCKKEKRPIEEALRAESRVDVVFQLQRSETGHVISNISSIMILQTASVACDPLVPELLPLSLPYKEISEHESSEERKSKIIELEPVSSKGSNLEIEEKACYESEYIEQPAEESFLDSLDYECSESTASVKNYSVQESSDSSDALKDILDRKIILAKTESSCDVFPDDLRMTIQKLTMQGALTEESGEDLSLSTITKRKSPVSCRVKSPYENQSYIIEEKKRRKLLEIRERRERKKMALAENCKITKHKYGKGTIMPQSASSVTKLSISNKSFYNSIYGQSTNADANKQKGRHRKAGKRDSLDISLDSCGDEQDVSSVTTTDKNSKKYINRSYYLDDAVTEMMYMNMKQNENDFNLCSASTSVVSNDFRNNLSLLSRLIGPSETEINMGDNEIRPDSKIRLFNSTMAEETNNTKELLNTKSILNMVPSNSPIIETDISDTKKITSSVECRKSIDKIYTLMNKAKKSKDVDNKSIKSKYTHNTTKSDLNEALVNSTIQGSDSGTSLKHQITSSNPSSFSFNKNNTERVNNNSNRKPGSPTAVVPKVIISSKASSTADSEKNKRDRKKSTASPIRVHDNPLKAISQLLHEFENVQKTRVKTSKKADAMSNDGRSGSRQSSFKRRSRIDQHNDSQNDKHSRVTTPKEKKSRPHTVMDVKIPYQQSPVEDKNPDKLAKKKIIDILDEAKEARGEAVRGPSKLNSRLNSLAQPKRSYVQAHSEEYQNKYGKTLMADRLQRLAAAPLPPAPERTPGPPNPKSKLKRSGTEALSAVSMKPSPSPGPSLERTRTRNSTGTSPKRTKSPESQNNGVGQSYKQINVPETPQTIRKKMVGVETYVKNHYGRATSTDVSPVNEPQSAQKSRVPLLPQDIELVSLPSSPQVEVESIELGSRLHHIISSIIKTNSQGIEVLAECQSNSKLSKDNTDVFSLVKNISKSERGSSDSDYALDILDDNNILTSVENIDKSAEKVQNQTIDGVTDATQYDLQPKSVTELAKLENALCQRISVGAFQKRLRIKNLTLTPKSSMQQVFLLQSGDAGSLLVKNSMTQNYQDTKSDNFTDLTALPVLSASHLDWRFANFPMQISTVGYAFPEYKTMNRGSTSLVKLFDQVSKSSQDKDNQCFKGAPHLRIEQAAQVDGPLAPIVAVEDTVNSHVMQPEKKSEMKSTDATTLEPNPVIIDFSVDKTVVQTSHCQETQTNVLDNKNIIPAVENSDGIEYTTSLDILVGLLNEIQNITTCQTQITDSDKNETEIEQSKELETILNKAAALENSIKSSPCDVLSFTSLDRLRQLESSASLYSFYLSDNEINTGGWHFPSKISLMPKELMCPKPIYADKAVSVDFIDKELVNTFTDVPSQMFPISKNHSTNVTNSLLEVLRQPSTQSMISFAEYHSVYSNTSSLTQKSVLDIPQIIITRESNQSLSYYEINKTIEKPAENKTYKKKIQPFTETITKTGNITKNTYRLKTDFDPLMKMKRDILVTFYSILVFTVFAALSFPGISYRV